MIGIGKWTGEIKTPFISGSAIVDIRDNNGEYDFSVTVPTMSTIPDFTVYDIKENGNVLSGKADISFMGKTTVYVEVKILGDTFEGFIKTPFGTLPIQNGRRV